MSQAKLVQKISGAKRLPPPDQPSPKNKAGALRTRKRSNDWLYGSGPNWNRGNRQSI